jgi:hypothetical protein
MKKNILWMSLLCLFSVACSKDDDDNKSTDTTPPVTTGMEMLINGRAWKSTPGNSTNGWSYQSSSPAALSVWGINDSEEVRLYIPTQQNSTGTFILPGNGRLIYSVNGSTSYPDTDSGEIVITEYSESIIQGHFDVTHYHSGGFSRGFTNGKFTVVLP